MIEENKKSYASMDERTKWGEWNKVASIPMPLYSRLKRDGIIDDEKKFKAWLNDADNRFFRTRPGRV